MKKNPFRRGMAGLLAAGTLVAAMPVLHFSAASQTMVGDANLDGAVTAADIVELQSYLFGKASFDETKFANCDLVADGTVNAFDLAMLKKKMRVTPPRQQPVPLPRLLTAKAASPSMTLPAMSFPPMMLLLSMALKSPSRRPASMK